MIPRAEIEFNLTMAEKGVRAEAPPEVVAELCRVYLSWLEAPEEVAEFLGSAYLNFRLDDAVAEALHDKRVPLVVFDD